MPAIDNVPAIDVLPVAAYTITLLELTLKSPTEFNEAADTNPEEVIVVADNPVNVLTPATVNVPAIAVLPVVESTVNLFVLTENAPTEFNEAADINPEEVIVVALNPANALTPDTFNVPAIEVFPDAATILNLFVLTDKSPTEFNEAADINPEDVIVVADNPANELTPVTFNVPAIAVLPDAATTLNLFVLTEKLPTADNVEL